MRRLTAYVFLLLLLLSGCGASADPDKAQESIQVIAMDTAMLITTYGERSPAAAYAAEDVIRDLEKQLSRTIETSDVSRLNAAGGEAVTVGADMFHLLDCAEFFRQQTGGAFDITVAPLVAAWGFAGGEEHRVPTAEEIGRLLPLVDGSTVRYTSEVPEGEEGAVYSASLGPGQAVDLGAIAKGYAADKIAEVLQEYEVPRANINLGGNVLAWGDRPDGTPWRVGVRDPARPDDPNALTGVLELTSAFAVTSGDYQRYFEEGGKRYHHIIDPATGRPADSGLTSVTVTADCGGGSGAMCDALSTALFVMGEERALDFWRGWSGTPFQLVLVTEDGRVAVTQGLADCFTLEEASGYQYEIVS